MKEYRSVKNSITAEYEEKRSRFLACIYPVSSEEEAEHIIERQSSKYYDAKHNVYAFRLKNGVERCSDDGEPSGTSGQPTLQVLKNADLLDVLIVTTRYFGGILLGGGGLFRAYTTAAKQAAEQAEQICYKLYRVAEICYPYSLHSSVLRVFSDQPCIIRETQYGEQVFCRFAVEESGLENFKAEITEISNGTLQIETKELCYIGG